MARLRVCFEIEGLAEDKSGYPCPAGLQIDLGEVSKEVPYKELVKDISIPALLKGLCLDHIPASAVRVITPEKYEQEYGEDYPIQEVNE